MNDAARSAIAMPAGFAARAGEVLAGAVPAEPARDAATVMLVRMAPAAGPTPSAAMQVYLLRRTPRMPFAPGALVFPGGSVDAQDTEAGMAWAGPDPDEWGRKLAAPPELARALVCAAVRETFEECGVLLAGAAPDTVVTSTDGPEWEADRRAVSERSTSLARLLRRRGLVLRSDLLRVWSHWITPVTEARRYDTRFFVAALPGDQHARDVSGEADEASWEEPGAVLAASRRGEVLLLPPTAVSLGELRDCGSVAAALAADRRVTPLMPEVAVRDGVAWLTLPPGVEYPR